MKSHNALMRGLNEALCSTKIHINFFPFLTLSAHKMSLSLLYIWLNTILFIYYCYGVLSCFIFQSSLKQKKNEFDKKEWKQDSRVYYVKKRNKTYQQRGIQMSSWMNWRNAPKIFLSLYYDLAIKKTKNVNHIRMHKNHLSEVKWQIIFLVCRVSYVVSASNFLPVLFTSAEHVMGFNIYAFMHTF